MKYIVGITGGSGAGKSSVSEMLREKGIDITDADKVAKQLMEPGQKCLEETVMIFGKDILDADGSLNRKKLADIVFTDKEKLNQLNSISHKYVTEYFYKKVKESKSDIVGIDGAVLFESGINEICDYLIGVVADENLRITRIIERDSISAVQATNRILSQKKNDFFIENCDAIVYNNGNITDLEVDVEEVFSKLRYEKEKKETELR